MGIHKDEYIIELLKKRNGIKTTIELDNGDVIVIWNIAWGYDIGDEYAHITTNISPDVENSTIDFFFTNEIKKLYDSTGHEIK